MCEQCHCVFERFSRRQEHDEENPYRIAISSSVNCDSMFRGSSQLYLTRSTAIGSITKTTFRDVTHLRRIRRRQL